MADNNYQGQNNADVQEAVSAALKDEKKKKKKKRLIIIAIIAVIIIIIGAVAGSSGDDGDSSPNSDSNAVSAESAESVEGQIGDYICTVKSAKLTKDYKGNDAVIITYEFTNNSSDSASFEYALDDKVFQDGVELEDVYFLADDEDLDSYKDVEIKTGVTKEVVKAYALRDTTTSLEVEIGEWLSFDDTVITTTVDIA
ncbi:MAG: DUF5067 domain-containing protein [Clostridiales bacterium]|nr:DUF5067 domain-containing protein [Clostridiales bacterium]